MRKSGGGISLRCSPFDGSRRRLPFLAGLGLPGAAQPAAIQQVRLSRRGLQSVPVAVAGRVTGARRPRRPCGLLPVPPRSAGRAVCGALSSLSPYRRSPLPFCGFRGQCQSRGITPLRPLGGCYRLPSRSRMPALDTARDRERERPDVRVRGLRAQARARRGRTMGERTITVRDGRTRCAPGGVENAAERSGRPGPQPGMGTAPFARLQRSWSRPGTFSDQPVTRRSLPRYPEPATCSNTSVRQQLIRSISHRHPQ